MRVGIGWKNHIATEAPFSGFSHGAAGVAWSLLRLADETGDARFHEAALQAIAYERTLFIPAASNWQDLRPPEPGETQRVNGAMAWCHGAPGIGLGRLLSVPYLDDPMCRTEIDIAVATTLKHGLGNYHPGFGHNYSLCHGDLGNLDIILETSLRSSAHAHLEEDIYDWAAVIMDNMAEYGWLCGVPHGIVTPGLMTGIAGIGYALLRLAAPTMVPSVLALAGPQPSPILQTPVAHLAALAV
jgi:lantibiotic modifying enzyme